MLSKQSPCWIVCAGVLFFSALPSSTYAAATFNMLVEEHQRFGGNGNDLFNITFDTLQDLNDAIDSNSVLTSQNLALSFDVAGVAYDGNQYHVLAEENQLFGNGNELFVLSYDSLQDFNDANPASVVLTNHNIALAFDVAGLAYDGSQYHMLVEEHQRFGGNGNDLFSITFDSLQDLIDVNIAANVLTNHNIALAFDVAGLAYDGNQFHMLVEEHQRFGGNGNDLFNISFDTLQDLIDVNVASNVLTNHNLALTTDVGGLVATEPAQTSVPVNDTLTLTLTGALLLAFTVFVGERRHIQ